MFDKLSLFVKVSLPISALALLLLPSALYAQDGNAEEADIEEIVVVGSQIRGANITEALAVSVISSGDIETMGIDSGDELMNLIPEQGQNLFSEAGSRNISGGVNAARGDVGAFNLRNIGTGNTLVLLNGRRLVNAATYQAETVGGSSVAVSSVNSQTLPVWGIERLEVLRDGASAIYGADAVAGVVNTVLKDDFDGFSVRFRWTDFENIPRDDQTLTLEWGDTFNEGRTNVGAFFNFYHRNRVNSGDDPRWNLGDHRELLPDDSPWKDDTGFRSTSAHNIYGQFDMRGASNEYGLNDSGLQLVDNAGDLQLFPVGHEQCEWDINDNVCGNADNGGILRYNLNDNRDLVSELDRLSLNLNITHEMENGMESFTELLAYRAETEQLRIPSRPSIVDLIVPADNYYNILGPCGSPNRLPDSIIGTDVPCEGVAWDIENYRFTEVPRVVNNKSSTYRVLQGFRGDIGDWNWESAVSWSRASKDETTANRVSNTLIQEALNDTTAAAYNPFSAGVDSNIERALIDVFRNSETELTTFDIKLSNGNLFSLPAGPLGFAGGFEWRSESFVDDRDPRLDGTIAAVAEDGTTFPFISDVVNSSPTPDTRGDRQVSSIFGELQIPVLHNLDLQLALRHENFDDLGKSATVGKAAFGWRPIDMLLLRGSWSEAFRAPNLVTVNEGMIVRQVTREDLACTYAAENGGDPNQDILDCTDSIQRVAEGSEDLVPEESENTSIGFVLTPLEGLTLTADWWTIEKENTIGLFGEQNHSALDLLLRLEDGGNNCAGAFNPAVVRDPTLGPDEEAIYLAAGICPAGKLQQVFDRYANLDTRTVGGYDIGIYYEIDSPFGSFNFKYNGAFTTKFEQTAGGEAARLVEARDSGILPTDIPVVGFFDLIRANGKQDEKHRANITWRRNSLGASLSANRIGDYYISGLTLDDGTQYIVPSVTTYDAIFDYYTEVGEADTRFRFGVKNLTNERAPLTSDSYGFDANSHNDYGRYVYLDVRARF